MSPSAINLFVFGIYIAFVGVGFLFIPNRILPLFKYPKTNEPWIRIIVILVMILAVYYIFAAQNELTPFFWASVVGRYAVLISFVLLIVAKKAMPTLLIFVIIDAAGAD